MKEKTTLNLYYGKYAYCLVLNSYFFQFAQVRTAIRTDNKFWLDLFYHHAASPRSGVRFGPRDYEALDKFFNIMSALRSLKDAVKIYPSCNDLRIYYTSKELDQKILSDLAALNFEKLTIAERFSPKHADLLAETAFDTKKFLRRKVVTRANKYPFKMMIGNLSHLVNDKNALDLLKTYEQAGLAKPARLIFNLKSQPAWHLKYSRSQVRVLDEATATLLTLALGKKYVRGLVEEVVNDSNVVAVDL